MSGSRRVIGRLVAAGTAAALARAGMRLATGAGEVPGGRARWERLNHAGQPLTMLEGPVAAAALTAGLLVGPGPARARLGAATAVAAAALAGAYDDLAERGTSKGLKGHLGALRRGEVTTGALKIAGLACGGLAAAAVIGAGPARDGRRAGVLDAVLGGAVVAGTANLVNLFDLRPGRSVKVAILSAAPLLPGAGGVAAATVVGAAAGVIGDDLGERSMLGDTGANAFGAALGCAVLGGCGRRGRLAVLAGLTALTLASEKVSFSRVIAATPVLRELDAWGRVRR